MKKWCPYLFLLLMACDKPLSLDVDFEGEKLVVYSVINPYSPITLELSKTMNPYQPVIYIKDYLITDAQITVTEDNQLFTTLLFDELHDVYIGDSSRLPVTGKTYHITVTTAQFGVRTFGPLVIPDTVAFIDFQVNNTNESAEMGFRTDVIMTIQDDANARNAYGYNIYNDWRSGTLGLGGLAYTWNPDKTLNEKCNAYLFENFAMDAISGLVFDDRCINGLEVTFRPTVGVSGREYFTVRFYTLDPILFEYNVALSKYDANAYDPGNFDAIRMPGNVEDGYGLVAAYNYVERVEIMGQ